MRSKSNYSRIYNVIGDVHGEKEWRLLVDDDATNIFVGDYFDPYKPYSEDRLIYNFLSILSYKAIHKNTILLLGNHDYGNYVTNSERICRKVTLITAELHRILRNYASLIDGIVYTIGDKYVISHAGVGRMWLMAHCDSLSENDASMDDIKDFANWKYISRNRIAYDSLYNERTFYNGQSPVWLRPWELLYSNVWQMDPYVTQVVGHTKAKSVVKIDTHKEFESVSPGLGQVIMTDTLWNTDLPYCQCLQIRETEDGNYEEYIKKVDKRTGKITYTKL